MTHDTWQQRLDAEIKAQKKSHRAVSIAAKLGPGVVNSWINDNEGKEPRIENLLAVCEVLNVSIQRILYGYEISADTEEILRLLEKNPARRQAILQLLKDPPTP